MLVPELPPESHPLLEELGYVVLTQLAARHSMHRDDPEGILDLLLGWVSGGQLVA